MIGMNLIPEARTLCEQVCGFMRSEILAKGVDFNEDTPLSDLDVDSLSLIEILLFIERRFGVRVPESHLTRENLHSVTALARCVRDIAFGDDPSYGRSPGENKSA